MPMEDECKCFIVFACLFRPLHLCIIPAAVWLETTETRALNPQSNKGTVTTFILYEVNLPVFIYEQHMKAYGWVKANGKYVGKRVLADDSGRFTTLNSTR